jgi:hypothetical protein
MRSNNSRIEREQEIAEALEALVASGSLLGQPGDIEAAHALWMQIFGDAPPGAIKAAVLAHMLDATRASRWPTPADIADQMRAVQARAEGEPVELSADEIWPHVIASLQGTHPLSRWDAEGNFVPIPGDVRFRRVLANKVGEANAQRALDALGGPRGYRELCNGQQDKQGVERAAFRTAWTAGARRERDAQVLRPLFGAPGARKQIEDGDDGGES